MEVNRNNFYTEMARTFWTFSSKYLQNAYHQMFRKHSTPNVEKYVGKNF